MGYSCTAFKFAVHDVYLGTAVIAADGLRIVAPCFGVGVFRSTFFAHGMFLHGGALPVIGHRFQYSQPGSALRTVYERVEIPPVLLVKELLPALVAGGDVGGYEDSPVLLFALYYLKAVIVLPVTFTFFHVQHHSPLGGTVPYGIYETAKRSFLARSVYIHIRALVCHRARDAQLLRSHRRERSEAHALNYPENTDIYGLDNGTHPISS